MPKQNLNKRLVSFFVNCFFLCLLLGITGCLLNEETSPEIIIPCEIKMQVSGLHTRMVETGPGDFSQIGVYGLRWETNRQAPSFTPGRFYFENMRFLLTDKGSEWFAETPLYYPERGG